MVRQLTPQSTLENLKREAKRWLKALRENVADARARLERVLPNASAEPRLRDVQHALALEHGATGWAALKSLLAPAVLAKENHAERVAWFLENACPDHHIRGGPDHVMARHTALSILTRYPEIARDSFYTAVVCGDLEEVERVLKERTEAASERSSETSRDRAGVGGTGDRFRKRIGPKGWEPLLYLCFTRLPLAVANDNAVAIARALLDRGADPNAFFMAGDSRYTPLVGVIGEGEEGRSPHPQREALTRLLLDRGAEPYDMQVVYNLGFRGEVLWFLKLIHARALTLGRQADWDDPNWSMLDMGGYGSGARWHLDIAVKHNDLELGDWILAHGASPNSAPARDPRFSQRMLHEDAVRSGFSEMAELLVRYGATRSALALSGEEEFAAACMSLDRERAKALAAEHPEYLLQSGPMMAAAKQDRADVVALLLDLAMSPDIEDPHAGQQRPLHVAASNDSLRVATLLIARGAGIDPIDSEHGGTPLWFAMWAQHQRLIELLSPVSRDVWSLSFTGNVERLRQVLSAEPRLATLTGDGDPPLMYLPGDGARAIEVVELFLARGADATIRNQDGMTAADLASKRGLDEAAEFLRSGKRPSPSGKDRTELADAFLEHACADPILANGPAAHAERSRAAFRMLQRYPDIARASIHTAVVCGDLDEVERILAARPEAATEPGGPVRHRERSELKKLWTPLLHLCYGRLPLPAASDNAVAIARTLLDHGANPNDYFEVGTHPSQYTALCGTAGEGEDDAPPHPQREALARLLLERGAEPFHTQLFYNTHFHGDIFWLLELIYEITVKAGRSSDWDDPEWSMIVIGANGHGARFLLEVAIEQNDLELAEWLLSHGASPNAAPMTNRRASGHTLHEGAQRRGLSEMADLLVRFGATPSPPFVPKGMEAFTVACFRLDHPEAAALLQRHPEYLRSHVPMFEAAERDRVDAVTFLLDLGASIEVEDDSKQRPLHIAASNDAFRVAELLIGRGADTEAVETTWGNTPLDHAVYGNKRQMIAFLSRFSRNAYLVTWVGNIDRLRELVDAEPELARAVKDGGTLLMWLPDDEPKAIEIAELLLAHGADPSVTSKEGKTAADYAEERALYDLADLLRGNAKEM